MVLTFHKNDTKETPADLLTVAEVADYFRVDGTTVRRWINEGSLDAVILPHKGSRRSIRIRRQTIDKLLGTTKEEGNDDHSHETGR